MRGGLGMVFINVLTDVKEKMYVRSTPMGMLSETWNL